MSKSIRLILIYGGILFCFWLMYPSVLWYGVLDSKVKQTVSISNKDLKKISEQLDNYVAQMREIITKDGKEQANRAKWLYKTKDEVLINILSITEQNKLVLKANHDVLKNEVLKDIYSGAELEEKIEEYLKLQTEATENVGILTKIGKMKSIKKRIFSLGLDLAGGTQFVLDMNKEELLKKIDNEVEREIQPEKLRGAAVEELKKEKPEAEPTQAAIDARIEEIKYRIISRKDQRITTALEDSNKQARSIIRDRIDKFGLAEVQISAGYGDRIVVELPGSDKDIVEIRKAITEPGLLSFHLVDEEGMAKIPDSLRNEEGYIKDKTDDIKMAEYVSPGMKVYPVVENTLHGVPKVMGKIICTEKPNMEGMVTRASVSYDQTGRPGISFDLTAEGGSQFARITEENVKRRFAIILDGDVKSAPSIREKISGGSAQITGKFTLDQAKSLSAVLESGNLPTSLQIVSESTVGSSMGEENIKTGVLAAVLGFLAVLIFMVLYYRWSGLIANMALVMNLFVTFAVLAGFQFTLSMPGIAGMVLSMAMSIDANVIIFERIREELHSGKTPSMAIQTGYGKAFRAILDANVTTVFAGVVLANLGTGILKGFGITLTIGIIASMITAIFVTRLVYDFFLSYFKVNKLSV